MEGHNFSLSEEQNMILDTVRKFVQDSVEPKALDNDEERHFVRENFDALGELGILGLPMSEASGGAEMGMLALAVSLEEIGGSCGSTGRLVLSQTALCGLALDAAGQSETAAQLAMGEKLGAFVGMQAQVTAEAAGDGFRLQGHAALVTAATEADLFVVAAHGADGEVVLFCVPRDKAQCEAAFALGQRASAPGRVRFDCEVGADAVMARGDAAGKAVERAQVAAWIGAAALAVGAGQSSIRRATQHASERVAFGKPLDKQQAVAHKIAESHRGVQAARHMVFHAARLADAGQDAGDAARLCKLQACEAAQHAADEGIQVLGGYGFTTEYHIERYYRDIKTLEVMDGGTEALKNAVAATLIG